MSCNYRCTCGAYLNEGWAHCKCGREAIFPAVHPLRHRLGFGRHKGKTILDVIEEDYDYAKWAARELHHDMAVRFQRALVAYRRGER